MPTSSRLRRPRTAAAVGTSRHRMGRPRQEGRRAGRVCARRVRDDGAHHTAARQPMDRGACHRRHGQDRRGHSSPPMAHLRTNDERGSLESRYRSGAFGRLAAPSVRPANVRRAARSVRAERCPGQALSPGEGLPQLAHLERDKACGDVPFRLLPRARRALRARGRPRPICGCRETIQPSDRRDTPKRGTRPARARRPSHAQEDAKEYFQYFWGHASPYWAGRFLDSWTSLARTLRTHREHLLNWFRARHAFAMGAVEGFNDKARVTTKLAYGFRTYEHAEIALLHRLGALPEPSWLTLGFV
ncbi:MAG: transposase [Polyangiaceae bacterium]